jgi:hypothetical protein
MNDPAGTFRDTALALTALAHSFPRSAAEVDEVTARLLREVKECVGRFATKAEEEAAIAGVDLGKTPASVLLPILEAARRLDDDLLRQMLARLLVANVEEPRRPRPVLVQCLSGMCREDAQAFLDICDRAVSIGLVGTIDGDQRPAWSTHCPADASETTLIGLGLVEWFNHEGKGILVPNHLGWLLKQAIYPRCPALS